jgi:hypothetical protein
VTFGIFTAVTMNITVFWGMAPCSLVEVKVTFLRNVRTFLSDYTKSHPRKQ